MELIMGLDMGTTHIKVGVFDLSGRIIRMERVGTKTHYLGQGKAIYQPDEIWESVVQSIRKITSQLTGQDVILSLSVASMGEAGLFLDESDNPLTPIMTWFDVRGKETMADWYELVGKDECFAITGLNYNYIYSLFKILWYKRHETEVMEKAAKWSCLPDFISHRLTGEYATDYSIASRTALFDITKRDWSSKLIDLAGLDIQHLPRVVCGGTVIGSLRDDVANLTGLPKHLPVSSGGHDHICGAFASGVTVPGRVLDSSGTAESLVAAFAKLPELTIKHSQGFNFGCHVVPDVYYLQGGVDSSGISVEWFKDKFYSPNESDQVYAQLITEARNSPPGAQGLIYVPHLRGGSPPVRAPYSKACFLGIRDYHTKEDFARSIFEGLCLEVSLILSSMEQVVDTTFQEMQAIGGGTKNDLWMEIKSTVTKKPIEIPKVSEASLLGAALLGAVGAGIYSSHQQAVEATYQVSQVYQPVMELVKEYNKLLKVYSQVVPLAREISQIQEN